MSYIRCIHGGLFEVEKFKHDQSIFDVVLSMPIIRFAHRSDQHFNSLFFPVPDTFEVF